MSGFKDRKGAGMKQKIGLFCVVLSLAAMPGCIDVKMSDVEKLFKQETESADKGNEPVEAVADTIVMISEEESDHLFFKGVPIDGSLEEYVVRMKYAGFEYIGTQEDGTAILQGDFAGFKACLIGVAAIQPLDIVNKIIVLFPERDGWASLEGDYNSLKALLTEKYGKPSECVEEFLGLYSGELGSNTEGDKLMALKTDACTWRAVYRVPKGRIELSVENHGGVIGENRVVLRYYDKINSEAVKQQALDDL